MAEVHLSLIVTSPDIANIQMRVSCGNQDENASILNYTSMSTYLIYDPAYLKHQTGVHPENPRRLQAIRHALESDELLSARLGRIKPESAPFEDIARCHDEELIGYIQARCEEGVRFLDADTSIS